jgi:hypothetical protein
MTKQERRGLELIKNNIRLMLSDGDHTEAARNDMLVGVRWIARQQGIDEKRRGPRGQRQASP